MTDKVQYKDGVKFARTRRFSLLACFAALALAVSLLAVPAAKYARAERLEREGDPLAAYELFDALGDYRDSAAQRDGSLCELCSRAVAARNYTGFNEYYALIESAEYRAAARDSLLATADSLLSTGLYESAFSCYSALGGDAQAAQGAQACRDERYAELVAEYEKTRQAPDGFGDEMLAGYADADKYAVLRELQSSAWVPDDDIDEVALLYSLGDFLNLREEAFITQRLYGNSYSNAEGYRFYTDEYGDWKYNLPYAKYAGYYGLYTKFIDNVLLTGSDEKQFWVEQFRFSLSANDEKLNVYCFATGGTIALTKDE